MFLRASLKLGLDQAILTGAEGKDMTKNELENLLRHGAYDLFRENDKESSKKSAQYNSENIEDILERSKVVTYDATNGTENHFSKRRLWRVRPKTMKLILTTQTFGAKRLACKCQPIHP